MEDRRPLLKKAKKKKYWGDTKRQTVIRKEGQKNYSVFTETLKKKQHCRPRRWSSIGIVLA